MDKKNKRNIFVKIAYPVFLAFYLFIMFYSISRSENYYIFDSILFIIFATLFYFAYNKLNMNWFGFLLINIAMILHELGRFGFFGMQFLGINYDIITHSFASIALANIFYFALKPRICSKEKHFPKIFLVIIILLCLALSTVGEFIEFGGSLYIKNGQGFLGIEPEAVSRELIGVDPATYGKDTTSETNITLDQNEYQTKTEVFDDYYDTLTDLLANTAGAIIGVFGIESYLKLKSLKNKNISKKKRK